MGCSVSSHVLPHDGALLRPTPAKPDPSWSGGAGTRTPPLGRTESLTGRSSAEQTTTRSSGRDLLDSPAVLTPRPFPADCSGSSSANAAGSDGGSASSTRSSATVPHDILAAAPEKLDVTNALPALQYCSPDGGVIVAPSLFDGHGVLSHLDAETTRPPGDARAAPAPSVEAQPPTLPGFSGDVLGVAVGHPSPNVEVTPVWTTPSPPSLATAAAATTAGELDMTGIDDSAVSPAPSAGSEAARDSAVSGSFAALSLEDRIAALHADLARLHGGEAGAHGGRCSITQQTFEPATNAAGGGGGAATPPGAIRRPSEVRSRTGSLYSEDGGGGTGGGGSYDGSSTGRSSTAEQQQQHSAAGAAAERARRSSSVISEVFAERKLKVKSLNEPAAGGGAGPTGEGTPTPRLSAASADGGTPAAAGAAGAAPAPSPPPPKQKWVNQYRMCEVLGRGAYGKVRRCVDEFTGGEVAVKILRKSVLRRKRVGRFGNALQDVQREVAIWKKLDHPHVVRLLEVLDDEASDKLYLFSELVVGGAVMPDAAAGTPIPLPLARRHFCQLIDGLSYLHFHHVVHRDIKPGNLLVDAVLGLRITDFGVSQTFDQDDATRSTAGTAAFLAPEMVGTGGAPFSAVRADVWACGMTLYMMLYGRPAFTAPTLPGLYAAIREARVPWEGPRSDGTPVDADAFAPALDLLRAVLQPDPARRATLEDIRAHPFVAGFPAHAMRALPAAAISVTEEEVARAITRIVSFKLAVKIAAFGRRRLAGARQRLAAERTSRASAAMGVGEKEGAAAAVVAAAVGVAGGLREVPLVVGNGGEGATAPSLIAV